MPDLLTSVPYTVDLRHSMQGFWCGDTDYAYEAADWIRGTGKPSVIDHVRSGNPAWIYQNCRGDRVGFGSLAQVDDWSYELDGQPMPLPITYLTMLAVHFDFQGFPVGDGEVKYCKQIVNHLLDDAANRQPQLVGLSVHPDNARAIGLYEYFGFVFLPREPGFSRMILRL